MPGVLNLAASGQLDMAQASDITTSILAGFNLESTESVRVADVLAAAASSAKTTVGDMGSAIAGAAPLANSLGISLEDVAAATATLQNNAIGAAESGIGFRNMLIRMLNISGPAEEALENFGLKASDLTKMVSEGNWEEALVKLKDAGVWMLLP